MTKKIESAHDRFFKESMGKLEVVESFLENYMPESIKNMVDISTLKPEKDSFIDAEMKVSYSDLLLNVHIKGKNGYMYFLFEHKSYYSKTTAHQMLKYMTAIWDAKINKEKKEELPIIIPIVFYQGKDEWKAGNSLGDLINGYKQLPVAVKSYIPNFEYLLYNVTKYSDEEIIGNAYLQAYLTIAGSLNKNYKDLTKAFIKALKYIIKLDNQEDALGYFETMVRYVLSVGGVRENMPKKEYEKLVKEVGRIYPEGSEVVMTIAEMLRNEGKEQGIEQGINMGIAKGKKETALKALKEDLPVEVIAKITGLPKEEIIKLTES